MQQDKPRFERGELIDMYALGCIVLITSQHARDESCGVASHRWLGEHSHALFTRPATGQHWFAFIATDHGNPLSYFSQLYQSCRLVSRP